MLLLTLLIFTVLGNCLIVHSLTLSQPHDLVVSVHLSNVILPLDTSGNPLITGETSVLQVGQSFFFYINDWGGCRGIDCCDSIGGCSSCCFEGVHGDPCVFSNNHSVVVYSTLDFQHFTFEGTALSLPHRKDGMEFRPHIVYCEGTHEYVLWYEDRWLGQDGYAVATSDSPKGPFTTVNNSVSMEGKGRIGDFDLFVDDDGAAYHIRTGITIERLSDNYLYGSGEVYDITVWDVEAPLMLKRKGVYYLLVGLGCCACRGGANVMVFTAHSPMGPFSFVNDVGSNHSQPFNLYSPYNFITHAQQSEIIRIPNGEDPLYLWMGNQWVTSQMPGNPRNHDLIYWTILQFDQKGAIQQIQWEESIEFNFTINVD